MSRGLLRVMAVSATGAMVVFGVSGCANPLQKAQDAAGSKLAEQLVEKTTGGAVDLDLGGVTGAGASIPDAWPGLPLPKGNVFYSANIAGTITLSVGTSEKEALAVIEQLKKMGYETISESSAGEFQMWALKNDEWGVLYSVVPDDETGGDVLVSYSVMPVDELSG